MDSADRVENVWGARTPHERGTAWPVRVDQVPAVAQAEVDRWVQSACVLCSNGCACDIGGQGRQDGRRPRPG